MTKPNEIRFRMPTPATGKNRRKVVRIGGKTRLIKSAEARRDAKRAFDAVSIECALLPQPVFGDDDVAVEIVHDVDADEIEVVVRSVRPRPKGKTGRRRDLQNLADVVLDAMQGVAYANDNAVVSLTMRRVLASAPVVAPVVLFAGGLLAGYLDRRLGIPDGVEKGAGDA